MSNLVGPLVFVVAVLAVLAGFAHFKKPGSHRRAARQAVHQLRAIAPRIPFALVAAECLGRLLPREHVASVLGADAGFTGVLFASVVGGLLPGGPMVTFPLAIALFRAGASEAPLVALLTAWSLMAFNRALIFEVPILGVRFTLYRILVSLPLPVLAGVLAMEIPIKI